MAKEKKSTGKAKPKDIEQNAVFSEITALLAHLIEIVERIDMRISGGF